MFGHDWEPAEGTCIDIRIKAHRDSSTDNRHWLMEVHCGDAEPFRVELGYPGFGGNFKGPERGHTCKMQADVKRQEAKWDLDDPALSWKADRQSKQADFQSELAAKPWNDQPGS
jgi:hypothetical protein